MYFLASGPLLGPQPWHWSPICIYRPWLPICIYRPWSQLCIYRPWPQIFIYRPWSVQSLDLHIPTSSPQFVFTGPGLIFITALSICIYLLIYSSSSGSGSISNSSNFLGLDNTNISMPILAWRANLGV